MRTSYFLLLVFATAMACQAHAQGSPCAPLQPRSSTALEVPLKAGEYTLTLFATDGPKKGRQVSGQLWLWHTSATDSSPRTGKRAVDTDTVRMPFYGATRLNFEAVGAPVFRPGSSDPTPAADSRDPVYPGVVVFAGNEPGDSVPASATLVIGSLSNMRDGLEGLDGAGIGLWVRSADNHKLVGDWSEWGIVRGGRGYFCLVPTP
jgi:hypothetical protein